MHVLFTTSDGLVSRIIRRYENFPASHVAIEINGLVYESVSKGVIKTDFNQYYFNNDVVYSLNLEKIYPYLLPIDEFTARNLAEKYLGENYGFLTLIGIVLNDYLNIKLFADGKKSFICSEYVSIILNSIIPNELNIDKIPDYITPKDLYEQLNKHEKILKRSEFWKR